MNEKNKISREKRKQLLKKLKSYMAPKKKELYLAAFFSYLQFLMRLFSFALIAYVFSSLYEQKNISLWNHAILLLLLNGFGYGFSKIAQNYQGIPSQYARDTLKKQFFKTFCKKEGEWDEETRLSDVLLVASQGIDSLDTYYSYYLALSLRTKLNCITLFILLLYLYPLGALLFVVCLPLIPISILASQKRSQKIMNRYWASYSDVGNLFMDHLKGLNTLDNYQVTEPYQKTFVQKAEAFRDSTMELLAFQLQSVAYMDSVMYIAISLAGLFALRQYFYADLGLFNLIFFVLIATEFFAPLREQGYGMHLLMMNAKMADKIFNFIDESEVEIALNAEYALKSFQTLYIEDLSFSFQKEKPLLEKVSLELQAGHLYVLAGESGLGKSSLARLLTGSLRPQTGKIFFGKQDSQFYSKTQILNEVLYVSPKSTLFNQTIYENLTLSCFKTKEEILAFIREHNLLNFVHELPEGLDTVVGEKGKLLSPGQVQQILCLRGFFAEKSFYILDEVSSSIDKDHEQALYHVIDLLAKKHIVLEITHKMKRVESADAVLFMSRKTGGKVTLSSVDKLKASSEEYRELLAAQVALEESIYGQ